MSPPRVESTISFGNILSMLTIVGAAFVTIWQGGGLQAETKIRLDALSAAIIEIHSVNNELRVEVVNLRIAMRGVETELKKNSGGRPGILER